MTREQHTGQRISSCPCQLTTGTAVTCGLCSNILLGSPNAREGHRTAWTTVIGVSWRDAHPAWLAECPGRTP